MQVSEVVFETISVFKSLVIDLRMEISASFFMAYASFFMAYASFFISLT